MSNSFTDACTRRLRSTKVTPELRVVLTEIRDQFRRGVDDGQAWVCRVKSDGLRSIVDTLSDKSMTTESLGFKAWVPEAASEIASFAEGDRTSPPEGTDAGPPATAIVCQDASPPTPAPNVTDLGPRAMPDIATLPAWLGKRQHGQQTSIGRLYRRGDDVVICVEEGQGRRMAVCCVGCWAAPTNSKTKLCGRCRTTMPLAAAPPTPQPSLPPPPPPSVSSQLMTSALVALSSTPTNTAVRIPWFPEVYGVNPFCFKTEGDETTFFRHVEVAASRQLNKRVSFSRYPFVGERNSYAKRLDNNQWQTHFDDLYDTWCLPTPVHVPDMIAKWAGACNGYSFASAFTHVAEMSKGSPLSIAVALYRAAWAAHGTCRPSTLGLQEKSMNPHIRHQTCYMKYGEVYDGTRFTNIWNAPSVNVDILWREMSAHVLGHGRRRTVGNENGESTPIEKRSTETMDAAPMWEGATRSTAMLYFFIDVLTFRYFKTSSSRPSCAWKYNGLDDDLSPRTVEHIHEKVLHKVFPKKHPLYFLLTHAGCVKSIMVEHATSRFDLLKRRAASGVGLDVPFVYDKSLPQWQRMLEDAVRMLISNESEGVVKMSHSWHVSADALRRILE